MPKHPKGKKDDEIFDPNSVSDKLGSDYQQRGEEKAKKPQTTPYTKPTISEENKNKFDSFCLVHEMERFGLNSNHREEKHKTAKRPNSR